MIGRDRELELLSAHLVPGAVVALVGPSGVGKTSIAVEFERRAAPETLFVDCFGMDPTAAATAIAEAAGVPTEHLRTDVAWVQCAEALADRSLVVLDDVGFPLDGLSRFYENLAPPLLLTCHVGSENVTVLPIAGLEVAELGEFEGSDALEVFLQAARQANLGFDVSVDDLETVHEIARRTHGLPLALSLAGRRAASTSPQTVLELLDDAKTLSDPSRTDRHASLAAALQFSWDGLERGDQRRLFLMSLFSRPLPPKTLAGLADEPLPDFLDGVHRLVARGFVTSGRFPRPLESFVEVASEQYRKLEPADAEAMTERIARVGFDLAANIPVGLSEHTDVGGDEPSLWQFILDRDDHKLSDDELSAVLAAWLRWATVRGLTYERLHLSPRVQALIDTLDDWRVWYALARHRSADPSRGLEAIARAELVAQTDREQQETQLLRAYLMVQFGRVEAAFDAIERARAFGEIPPLGHIFIAEALLMDGQLEAARAEAALLDGRDDEFNVVSRAYLETLRAWIAPTSRDALLAQQRAVELCVQSGQLRSEAAARQSLAMLLAFQFQRYDDALAELDHMASIAQKIGDHRFASRAQAAAVAVHVLRADYEDAVRIAEAVVGTGDPAIDDYCYLLWLIARWQLGDQTLVRQEWAKKELEKPPPGVPSQDVAWAVFDVQVAMSHDPAIAAKLADKHRVSFPDAAPLFDAMLALQKLQPASDFKALLKAWHHVRTVWLARDGSLGVELCWRLLQGEMPPEMHRFLELEQADGQVRILADFQALLADDVWHDLSTQPVSQRLLQVLFEADEPLAHDAVGVALYPDEIVVEEAMKNRIDVQVSKLRKLGLRPYLAKRPEGFVLEGDIFVAVS